MSSITCIHSLSFKGLDVPSIIVIVLVADGHSVWFEHIVLDYNVVTVPGYIVVVPPFVAMVQTAAAL